MTQYEWKIKSLAKGIDPDKAIKELEKVQKIHGSLTAQNVLNVAQKKTSPLHKLFEWDNSKAAEKYRMHQARVLINNVEIKYISDGEERHVPAYEIVKTDGGQQYKHIESLTHDEIEYVRQQTINSLNILKVKLKVYNQFEKVVKHLDLALEEIS